MGLKIDCSFSLLEEGRKYTGNHRKYVIENAREICYAPETREKIKNREALGYYGHGRRILGNKMDLPEVDVVKLPDGQHAVISNIPSNVTTKFDVSKDGSVTHTQEVLDSETGRIVAGLHASRVGGFSWACPGIDGGTQKPTRLTGFSGFDYVLNPGFSANRGYVLESAQGDVVLESVTATIGDAKKAAELVAGWRELPNYQQVKELEDKIFDAEAAYSNLLYESAALKAEVTKRVMESVEAKKGLEEEKNRYQRLLSFVEHAIPFFIPEDAVAAILRGDFTRAQAIFESAQKIDYSQYPVPFVKSPKVEAMRSEFGTVEYGMALKV